MGDHLVKLGFANILVSLFNGISTFVDYLMPNLSLLKNSSGNIKTVPGEIKEFIPFPRVLGKGSL